MKKSLGVLNKMENGLERRDMFSEKVVLVTGGTGSFGNAFIRRILLTENPKKVIVFSRDEFKQSQMEKELSLKYEDAQIADSRIRYMLGDIRDALRLKRVLAGVDIVVHAAALKQVPALEYNPTEAISTNVDGARNLVDACIDCGVEKLIALSTDKAVNPVNLYGATKLCMEKVFTAANAFNETQFSCVRYGNVIGSRGSVIPFFQNLQKHNIKEFPITDLNMTRFWLTLDQAVQLVLDAFNDMGGGEIYVPRIPSMKVAEVARAIEPECTFKEIGIRPGEKMHETLVSEDNANVYHLADDGLSYRAEAGYTSDTNDKWLSAWELRRILKLDDGFGGIDG